MKNIADARASVKSLKWAMGALTDTRLLGYIHQETRMGYPAPTRSERMKSTAPMTAPPKRVSHRGTMTFIDPAMRHKVAAELRMPPGQRKTYEALREEYGTSVITIRRIAAEEGLNIVRGRKPTARTLEIGKRYYYGENINKLAKEYGLSKQRVAQTGEAYRRITGAAESETREMRR